MSTMNCLRKAQEGLKISSLLIAQIGSLKVVPNVCRELRVEQLNINGLHWGIIVGAFKCLTIYDVAGVLRVPNTT